MKTCLKLLSLSYFFQKQINKIYHRIPSATTLPKSSPKTLFFIFLLLFLSFFSQSNNATQPRTWLGPKPIRALQHKPPLPSTSAELTVYGCKGTTHEQQEIRSHEKCWNTSPTSKQLCTPPRLHTNTNTERALCGLHHGKGDDRVDDPKIAEEVRVRHGEEQHYDTDSSSERWVDETGSVRGCCATGRWDEWSESEFGGRVWRRTRSGGGSSFATGKIFRLKSKEPGLPANETWRSETRVKLELLLLDVGMLLSRWEWVSVCVLVVAVLNGGYRWIAVDMRKDEVEILSNSEFATKLQVFKLMTFFKSRKRNHNWVFLKIRQRFFLMYQLTKI